MPDRLQGIVPWWRNRVGFRRDCELMVNELTLTPHRVGRIHWRIFPTPLIAPDMRIYTCPFLIEFWADILEEVHG